jgi:hypothetical protein
VTLETGVTRRMKRESDSVVLASLLEKSKILKSVSLRSTYLMLKLIRDGIDVTKFLKLPFLPFLSKKICWV